MAPNKNPDAPKARDLMTMSSLPKQCMAVLNAPSPASEAAVTLGDTGGSAAAPAPAKAAPTVDAAEPPLDADVFSLIPIARPPLPLPRPSR